MIKQSPKSKLYLAYGSNINLEQMAVRCPTAEVVGKTALNNHRLTFRGSFNHGVATVEREKGSAVPVLIWRIHPSDEAALDRYEGFPHLYHKETRIVELAGKRHRAMIYIMNRQYPPAIPTPNYYQTIMDGYTEAGFNYETLEKAVDDVKDLTK